MFNNIKLIFTPFCSVRTHSHLLREFISKEIKGRFAGSVAGILWTLINPLANIAVYLFIFSLIMRIQVTPAESGTDRFVVFFLSGFFPWLIFSESLSKSAGVLIQNANLIVKVVFPVELLPAGTVFSTALVHLIGMTFFLLYLIFLGCFHPSWLILFYAIPALMVFAWGLCSFFSAICVFIRDIGELLSILLMLWFYATPIIYPMSLVPESFRAALELNPLNLYISLIRNALLFHQIIGQEILLTGICSLLSYALGSWFFMRSKSAFGDVL